jgi:hypothetical protein
MLVLETFEKGFGLLRAKYLFASLLCDGWQAGIKKWFYVTY